MRIRHIARVGTLLGALTAVMVTNPGPVGGQIASPPQREVVAAFVNGTQITLAQLDEEVMHHPGMSVMRSAGRQDLGLLQQFRPEALETLIAKQLLEEDGRARRYFTDAEIAHRTQTLIHKQFGSQETFETTMKMMRSSPKEFTEQTRQRLLREVYMEKQFPSIAVPESEIQRAYAIAKERGTDLGSVTTARPVLLEKLVREKREELLKAHLITLRSRAKVEILLPALPSPPK